jgi:predicted ATP-dependent Lon-type protease
VEYLLGSYCASNDETVIKEGPRTVKKILAENYVRPDDAAPKSWQSCSGATAPRTPDRIEV